MQKDCKQIRKELFSKEFKQFFNKKIKPRLGKIENLRQKTVRDIAVLIVASVSGIICILFFCGFLKDAGIIRFVFVVIILLLTSIKLREKSFKNSAKKIFLPALLSFIGEIEIVENSDIKNSLRNYIENIKLMPYFDIYSCDDYLRTTYKDIKLDIAEISLKKDMGKKNNSNAETIFSGLFITFKSFKKFEGYTIIKADGLKIGGASGYIKLEDPEFEKIYDVSGSNQIEARYLLTTAFMNRLVEISKTSEIGRGLIISFEQGNVNIGINSSKDWFDIPVFRPSTDIKNYKSILKDIFEILSVIDTLKFDQKIGL